MNKLFFALLFVAFAGSLCFAEETAVSSGTSSSQSSTTKLPWGTLTFTGTITKMSSGTIMKRTNLEITAKDSTGEESTFILADNAVVTGKDGNKVSANWLSDHDKVSIEYAMDSDGVKTAKAVKMLSGW